MVSSSGLLPYRDNGNDKNCLLSMASPSSGLLPSLLPAACPLQMEMDHFNFRFNVNNLTVLSVYSNSNNYRRFTLNAYIGWNTFYLLSYLYLPLLRFSSISYHMSTSTTSSNYIISLNAIYHLMLVTDMEDSTRFYFKEAQGHSHAHSHSSRKISSSACILLC